MVDIDIEKVANENAAQHVKIDLAEYLEKGIVKILCCKLIVTISQIVNFKSKKSH